VLDVGKPKPEGASLDEPVDAEPIDEEQPSLPPESAP